MKKIKVQNKLEKQNIKFVVCKSKNVLLLT